ncbi:TrmH family RNA methyltransferase [Deinococcus peraridilitoris]|uniref:rRNA methylase n=1 Tax=Deinococcus peraridilitoris (strain DSM 19664 / LMG 22246 / CIP 109416 / KR-200) TaxID=937777 RepID=L0A507_DEIPD|nr:RNA methyltransferase [Deinococcus peraridilitoris]AFZ68968.1 rRNA methylase [Deinococcus peraridilitoris DSM 19664]
MRVITSPQNPEIKALARLKDRRDRERDGYFLIEGTRELSRALQGGVQVERVYLCKELLRPEGHDLLLTLSGPELLTVSRVAFDKLSVRENPDGLVGIAPLRTWDLPALPQRSLVLVLAGLEKPGNLGALLRTADAVGVDAVIIAGRGADLHNPNVIRASQGSVFSLPLTVMTDEDALAFLRDRGITLFAVTPEGAQSYWHAELTGSVALVLGTEHSGLDPVWKAAARERLSIPMQGAADSLNVATAGALVLYEALRQRQNTMK